MIQVIALLPYYWMLTYYKTIENIKAHDIVCNSKPCFKFYWRCYVDLGLGTIVLVVVVILVILAIIGLGWQGFFGGVKKGADKLGITSLVTNLTDQFKNELSKRVGNIT